MNYAKNQQIYNEEFSIAGTSFRPEVFEQLIGLIHENEGAEAYWGLTAKELREDLEYGGIVYKYESFSTHQVTLEKEPDNEYDQNAIKIFVHGIFVGYIPKAKTAILHNAIDQQDLDYTLIVRIVGGPYKKFDIIKDKIINVKNENFGLKLKVIIYDKNITPEEPVQPTNTINYATDAAIQNENSCCLIFAIVTIVLVFLVFLYFYKLLSPLFRY